MSRARVLETGLGRAYLKVMKNVSLLAALLMCVSIAPLHADSLDGLQGKKRPLLLFAKSRSYAGLDKQIDLLRDRRPDISERDMVVLVTQGNQDTISAIGYASLPPGAALDLKTRFKPNPSGLTVVLIGKDGGEKARWDKLVQPQEIFDLIDSMPMRQSEMRNGG